MARYAIYFTPDPESRLWTFGSSIVGYDAATGDAALVAHDAALRTLLTPATQADPARYGFHATLKAPFELASETSLPRLLEAAGQFACAHRPVDLGLLTVTQMGSFVALTPANAPADLACFAGDCVRAFDDFRRPLSELDRQRRSPAKLTPRQVEYLDRWGYPYVFEEFRFHMTLTGSLPPTTQGALAEALQAAYERVSAPVLLDSISVLEQPERSGKFKILKRFPLRA